jgi:ribosomal protein S18 acetylase RimI-like enzyme
LIIRELKSKDLITFQNLIFELMVETYMSSFQLSIESCRDLCQEKLEGLFTYIDEGSAIIYGAFDSEKLIGFQWLHKNDFFGEDRLHVNQIAVSKEYRGEGIGKQLIHVTKQKAEKLGIKTIDLIVSESNVGALKLYEQIGFKTERRYMKWEM